MGLKGTTPAPATGASSAPVTRSAARQHAKASKSSNGTRSVKEGNFRVSLPRKAGQNSSVNLSARAIRQLKTAVQNYNTTHSDKALADWCRKFQIKTTNPLLELKSMKLISESPDGRLRAKSLKQRKVQKSDTDHDKLVKAAIKAAKKIKPKQKKKKRKVKTSPAALGKKRKKSGQNNDPSLTTGESAIVPTKQHSNPLWSVNSKDVEQGPEGAKADKITIHTQKGKKKPPKRSNP